jgi:hypothetical protein
LVKKSKLERILIGFCVILTVEFYCSDSVKTK